MLRVLVVDDSAVARQAIASALARQRDFAVAVAADPVVAERRIELSRPHVVVLDLEMPRIDGLTFLEQVMRRDPLPIVICSGVAGRGTEAALRALQLGAVEVVEKPAMVGGRLSPDSAELIIDAVRGAASAKVGVARPPPAVAPVHFPFPSTRLPGIVAVGASTGGTEAIRQLLAQMPADAPGFVIVQHMPAGFTATFARQLDQTCAISVAEARPGDCVRPGRALIAPGGRHMAVVRRGHEYVVEIDEGPLVSRHRPSVDVLFRSVAEAAGANAIGIILTGMGDDGADGLLRMKSAGAFTIAQSEATCVVFGMPREAIARGAALKVTSISQMGAAIAQWASRNQRVAVSAR